MRIFVSEYVAGGAMADSLLPGSLLGEGRAMLAAVITDLLVIPGCRVTTTLDQRLRESTLLPNSQSLDVEYIHEAKAEQLAFDRLCTQTDATLVIAPETGDKLRQRVQRVVDLGRPTLNCTTPAIDLCGDKLRLAEYLIERGLATINTCAVEADSNPWDFFPADCVVKPRDGAGSWMTFLIPHRDAISWERARVEMKDAGVFERTIVQPYIAGQTLAVGCLCDAFGNVEIFPIARQHLKGRTFQYQGGSLPAELNQQAVTAIQGLVRSACKSIQGLRGYIGIDLLLPDADPRSPLIVEFNPRLTTSYVGYRKLCRDNIAERMRSLALTGEPLQPLAWNSGAVHFDAGGNCQYQPMPTGG